MKKRRTPPRNPVDRLPTYSLTQEMCASATRPMDDTSRKYNMDRLNVALGLLIKGNAPAAAWTLVSDAINVVDTLVREGTAADGDHLLADTICTMAEVANRYDAGDARALSEPEAATLSSLVTDYGQIIEELPLRQVIRAHRKTEKRLAEMIRSKDFRDAPPGPYPEPRP